MCFSSKNKFSRPNGQFWPTACHTFFESSACNLKYFGTFLVHPVMRQIFPITLRLNCHYHIALCPTTSLVLTSKRLEKPGSD